MNYQMKYYRKNREQILRRMSKYGARADVKKNRKKYLQANRKSIKVVQKKYYAKNRISMINSAKKRYAKNAKALRLYALARYYAKKESNENKHLTGTSVSAKLQELGMSPLKETICRSRRNGMGGGENLHHKKTKQERK